jgi:hypothetical protein
MSGARLIPLEGPSLPDWCEPFLDSGRIAASRAWWDATLAEAVPRGWRPVMAVAGCLALPLLARGRRLASLTTPYTLSWSPLARAGASPAERREAGSALARLLRWRPPLRLEAVKDPADPALAGLAEGLVAMPYRHFGHWHETLPPGLSFEAWLERRPSAQRSTVRRKLARAEREGRFELHAEPGPALEAAIADFEAVRGLSWKPPEPAPRFDAALMRGFARAGALRLALLRRADGGAPIAAQYWLLEGRRAVVPKLFHAEAERAMSPGTALTAWMIRHLLERDGVRTLDFGRGDDPYKRLWVTDRAEVQGLVIADPRHPEGALAVLRQRIGNWRRATSASEARSRSEALPGRA